MTGKKKSARQDNGLAAQLTRWRKLVGGVQRNLGDLAYTAEHNAKLEKLAEEILHSTFAQQILTQQLRALIRERHDKVRQARDLRSRLAAAVVGHFGPCSDKLRQFGLRPRGRRVVRGRGVGGG